MIERKEMRGPMNGASFIVVSDTGDPRSPRTWSGTPSNLISALQDIGCEVSSLNLTPPRLLRGALSAVSWASAHGRQYRRTHLASAFYSSAVEKAACGREAIFLHTGTSTIPHGPWKKRGRHVLYLDSTFHLMSGSSIQRFGSALLRKYDEFERSAISAAEHVFTISECTRADIIDHYGISAGRVTAVGTGIGKIRPMDGEKDYSACTTLFVAKERFEEKGGRLLLSGFRLAQKSDPRLKLTIVATEPYRRLTEEVPGATFKTALPWEELEACFNNASLFAMPAFYEPWGLVYLEALACRTPVLGMNRNALPEIVENGKYGFLLNEGSPASISATLLSAFSDIKQLAKMGSEGQNHIRERYSWYNTAQRIHRALF